MNEQIPFAPWKAMKAAMHPVNRDEVWVPIQGEVIAFDLTFPPIVTKEQAQQIANLTSAAPELLEALNGVLALIHGAGLPWNNATAIVNAAAAIAKATGKDQG